MKIHNLFGMKLLQYLSTLKIIAVVALDLLTPLVGYVLSEA